ncbi:MAG: hypothetical protein IPH45_09895 [Bacteroidales bacterium]|nr:hypothetical protein [Bacteroidales bacterium]
MKKLLFILSCLSLFTNVFSQNNPPVAVNDTVRPVIGFPFEVNILKNDFDPDGDSLFVPLFEIFRINDSTWEIPPDYYDSNDHYDSIVYKKYFLKDEHGAMALGSIVIIRKGTPRYDSLDINNIKALISPFGNHFWDLERARSEVPKGSATTSIFNHALWIGGLNDSSQLCLAVELYRQVGTDFFMGPISSFHDSTFPLKWNRVWKLDKNQILFHRNHWAEQGYSPIEVIENWPAHGTVHFEQSANIAPFYDSDQDGKYEPHQGDYPIIRGDQAVFFVLNDAKDIHTESSGRALGIEIHGMAYAYDRPDDSTLNNTIFMHYEILNRSLSTYTNTMIGLFCEFDLGSVNDDFLGCDVTNGLIYVYNGYPFDGNGENGTYGCTPPAFGLKLIGGPFLENDGLDNEKGNCDEGINGLNFGDKIPDNERMGLSYFVNGTINGEFGYPPSGFYNLMRSIRNNGFPYMFGDSLVPDFMFGYNYSGGEGPACRYFYPGNSDTLCNWGTYGLAPNGGYNTDGHFWTDSLFEDPGDRRGLGSVGPFTFQPGESIPWIIVLPGPGIIKVITLLPLTF